MSILKITANHIQISFSEGWYPEEKTIKGTFRWMKKRAKCTLKGLPTQGRKELIIVGGHSFQQQKNPKLKVFTDNETLGTREIFPSIKTYPFPLKNRSNEVEICLELDQTFKSEQGRDKRELGIMIEKIGIHSDRAIFFPSIMEIESSTICNINPPCVMCYPRIFDKRQFKSEIKKSTFQKLVPYLKEFRTISLHGVGEPLLSKNLFVILDNINTDKTDVQFNSNGLLLTEELSRKLIQKKMKLIDFSLDAATSETYKRLRRSDFSLVTRNIKRLSELKRELKIPYPVIKLNMTLMKENIYEVLSFIELAKRLEAKIIHLGLLNPFKEYKVANDNFIFNYKDQMLNTDSDTFKTIIEQAKEKALEMNIELFLEFSTYYS